MGFIASNTATGTKCPPPVLLVKRKIHYWSSLPLLHSSMQCALSGLRGLPEERAVIMGVGGNVQEVVVAFTC